MMAEAVPTGAQGGSSPGSPVGTSATPRLERRSPALGRAQRRALVSYAAVLLVWQLGSTSPRWLGYPLPWLGHVPAPGAVLSVWARLLTDAGYWQSWCASSTRVFVGFAAAVVAGVPLGLFMALNPTVRAVVFPVFELLRPIPPLAWVPAAIIFWPTQELSIAFVIFIGAFYTMVLNALDGADAIDIRLIQVARSMGASRWNIFHRLVLRAVLPSVLVGMEVSIGITWEVVVAAEMISGGGPGGAAAAGGGLGFFIWNSYVGGSYPQIIVGMISIGIAGYLSSAVLRMIAARFTRWGTAQ
jgi:NitT/TauT family transport system permease protein